MTGVPLRLPVSGVSHRVDWVRAPRLFQPQHASTGVVLSIRGAVLLNESIPLV
jgi:hypothetical protein